MRNDSCDLGHLRSRTKRAAISETPRRHITAQQSQAQRQKIASQQRVRTDKDGKRAKCIASRERKSGGARMQDSSGGPTQEGETEAAGL